MLVAVTHAVPIKRDQEMKSVTRNLALAAWFALALAHPASATTNWTMVSGYPDNNFVTENLREFIDEVERETGGELKITLHSNGSLIKIDNIRRALQTGQAQIGEIRLGSYGNEDPIYILDNIPFLTKDYKEAWTLMEKTAPYLDKIMGTAGIKVLGYQPFAGQGFFTKSEIRDSKGLEGFKLRIYSKVTQDMGQKMGAKATILPFADIPQAFATGMIDALFTSAQTGIDIQAWNNTSHFTYVGANFNKTLVGVNKAAYDSLPEKSKEVLIKAGRRLSERAWKLSERANQTHLDILKDNKMTVYPPPADLIDRLTKVGSELAEEWKKAASPAAIEVLQSYQKEVGR
jgi:TRAP-type C4-dicarboxylate transport system substrate-binding protein